MYIDNRINKKYIHYKLIIFFYNVEIKYSIFNFVYSYIPYHVSLHTIFIYYI